MLDLETRTDLTAAQLMILIAKTQFSPFTEGDWNCFMGCESSNPFIGYIGTYTIVLDGDTVNVIEEGDEYGGQLFKLSNMD